MFKVLTGAVFLALLLSGPPKMGTFLIIVVKLYSYKYSDVTNIQKIKYVCDYFRPSRKT